MKESEEKDIRILKNKISSLSFICGVSLYCDPTASVRHGDRGRNIFSIVREDGTFQGDGWRRFYFDIKVNELGLFELTYQGIRDDKSEYTIGYVRDFTGKEMSYETFQTFLELLKKRKKSFSPSEYYQMEDEIRNSSFLIVNDQNVWVLKEGHCELKWGKRDDGLEYLNFETHERPDRYFTHHEIKDNEGNQISLNDYYSGFLMLENGRQYLNELRNSVAYRV